MAPNVLAGIILILISVFQIFNPLLKKEVPAKYFSVFTLSIYQGIILIAFGVYVILLGPASMTWFNLGSSLVISGLVAVLIVAILIVLKKREDARFNKQ